MSVSYGKGAKGKATKLHSIIIRSQGECEACEYVCPCEDKWKHTAGCKLQAAHIQGRKASRTRTLLINAFCLCASCHRKFTDQPLTFSRFVTTTWAQEYRQTLLELSRPLVKGQKTDWDWEVDRLNEIKKRLMSGETTLAQEREAE